MIKNVLIKEEVVYFSEYDEVNGGLINKYTRSHLTKRGSRAASLHSRGYMHVYYRGKIYKEHILVWIYFNGDLPPNSQIDHKDGNRSNNKIDNLRLSNGFLNQQNRNRPNKNNKSGFKGVHSTRNGTWVASIMANRVDYKLGTFQTKEEAALAYNEAAKKYHGEYAKLNAI